MKLKKITIENFKSIKMMRIDDIDNALILVGKNNTGKTAVLDAVRLVSGQYKVTVDDFHIREKNIVIDVQFKLSQDDYRHYHKYGIVSKYKRQDLWDKDFFSKLPSLKEDRLSFRVIVNKAGTIRYDDGTHKNNKWIPQLVPKAFFIDSSRNLKEIEDDVLMFQDDSTLQLLRQNHCIFDKAKQCRHCFHCIGLIHQKKPAELKLMETVRLMEYKLFNVNLNDFTEKVNHYFKKNGGYFEEIQYQLELEAKQIFNLSGVAYNEQRNTLMPVHKLSKGMRSIYILSMLEAYIDENRKISNLILIEDPEIFLHPQLQKLASEVLYRLSKKNQVIFSTHSPNMLFNFTSKQIRQIVLDKNYYSIAREKSDIDEILDDLGYTANDLMNVSFVFIVEGKQDKNRLPLLLKHYYSEIYNQDGELSRVAIITTNSCTNIKTYANLKYMNKMYLKDQFLMIRDGDGEDPERLARQLCRYYEERNMVDVDKLPKVTRKNVLILKYYSFENYFLNPEIMAKLGIIEQEEQFYDIFLEKWKLYLHRMKSGRKLVEKMGRSIETTEDVKYYMEDIKTYIRGHNLYDIYYGPYKKEESQLLKEYIKLAPREDFKDILDAIDRFVYFENRARKNNTL